MLPSASRLGPRAGGPVQRRVPLGCLGPSHLPQAALFLFHLCPLREEGDSLREASPRAGGHPHSATAPHAAACSPPPSHALAHVDGGFAGVCEEGGWVLRREDPAPPGLSPPPGGLLGWPQTHSLDTREGRAVCRSGHVSLCGPARPWVLTVLGDGPSGPSPRKGPSRPAEQGQEMPWRPGDSLVLDVTWLPPTATAVQTQGPCSRGAVCGSSLGYRAV